MDTPPPPPPPLPLRLQITQLATNRHDLAIEDEALFVTLTGKLLGPVEGLLPLIREQARRRPTVEIAVALVAAGGDGDDGP